MTALAHLTVQILNMDKQALRLIVPTRYGAMMAARLREIMNADDDRSARGNRAPRLGSATGTPRASRFELAVALEEGCGVLLVLEASRARLAAAPVPLHPAEADLDEAIVSLRETIASLRARLTCEATSALAAGFVITPSSR